MYQAMSDSNSQRERLRQLMDATPIVRHYELRHAGIAAATITRATHDGELIRISRGLYQRADGEVDAEQSLAEAAKLVPRGVIAMTSALAFHGLTDQMPRAVWVAIREADWAPVPTYPPIRIIKLDDRYMQQGVEQHTISGVTVPIFSVAKTLADVFRNKLVNRSIAIESLRAAIEQQKTTPAAIAQAAIEGRAWKKMRPYLEALTADG
jgi:predicted transcriptional regulator of viral defense system